jgi:hypothetical protein
MLALNGMPCLTRPRGFANICYTTFSVLCFVLHTDLIRALLVIRFKTTWSGANLYPVGLLLVMGNGLNSWFRSSRGGVCWKGHRYTLPGHDTSC